MTWRRSAVPAAGTVCGLLLAAAAVAYGRADVAVVGVVLLVAVVASARRPGGDAGATVALHDESLDVDESAATEPATRSGRVRVDVSADSNAELVLLRLTALGFETQRLAVAAPSTLRVSIPFAHSGDQQLLAEEHRTVSLGAAFVTDAPPPSAVRIVVEPDAVPLPFLPLPARLRGLTGSHESSRPGDGGDFRDIHPFATGDRLRRIDWKATARLARRPGDLFVRRTNATSDADVAIVLDDADDIGEAVVEWGNGDPTLSGTTSMDLARDAAWSFASAYLAAGDAVSFQVLSRAGGAVRRGAGARHRERLRAAIAQTDAHARLFTRARTPLVASGAIIVLLSTFLDRDAVRLAELWRASGHRVLAVDTLPRPDTGALNRKQRAALRVVLGVRGERLRELTAIGADVVSWHDEPAVRAAQLRTVSRPRRP